MQPLILSFWIVSSWMPQVVMTDVTDSTGVDALHEFVNLQTGIQASDSLPGFGGAGAAADFDRDGWTDLVLSGGPGGEDTVFLSQQDGTFSGHPLSIHSLTPAASAVAGPGGVKSWTSLKQKDLHFAQGIAVGDYDGDGLLDIFIMSLGQVGALKPGQHRLWHNEGGGKFTEVADQAGVGTTSTTSFGGTGCAFGDYDLDGDLDLIAAGWRFGNDGNRLFRNDGDGTFTDATSQSGFDVARMTQGFVPSLHDMNGDRYPEIVLASDFGLSRYLINNGDGTFTDGTATSATFSDTNGMGQTIFDFDLDGLFDIYRTSIDALPNKTGNQLYRNLGNDQFAEVGISHGVQPGFWGWGTVATDLDLDGYEDLIEVNGWRLPGYVDNPARMWLNNAGLGFTEVSQSAGLASGFQGRGVLAWDYDRDGDQDVVVTRNGQSVQLFRNDQLTGHNWFRIYLDTSARPDLAPDGVGSLVTMTFGGLTAKRYVYGHNTHMGQSEFVAHFGIGPATQADSITVEWADGTQSQLTDVQASRYLIVKAP